MEGQLSPSRFIIPNSGNFCNRVGVICMDFLAGAPPNMAVLPRGFGRRRPSGCGFCRRVISFFGIVWSSDVALNLFSFRIYCHFWSVFRVCFLFVYKLLLQCAHFVWYNGDTRKREPTDTHRRRADTSAVGTLRRVRHGDEERRGARKNLRSRRKEGRV